MQIEQYCGRNLQKRDERIEAERRRQHEAQHAQLGGALDEEKSTLTAGENATLKEQGEEEEEEEKEVDPLIVGSLDDVYKDEPGDEMKEEDPFKKAPVMDDHEKPSSMMEMEKSLDAMVALVEHTPGSPVPEDATNLDSQLRERVGEGSVSTLIAGVDPPLLDLAQLEGGGGTSAVPPPSSQAVDLAKGVGLPLVSSS